VKAWLSDHQVQYTVRNVVSDLQAQEEFLRQGFLLPPVVVVGQRHVAGYKPESLAAVLGIED
jgi:Glutaredoxin